MQFLKNFLLLSNGDSQLINNIEYCMHGIMLITLAAYFFPRWFMLLKNSKRSWLIIFKIFYLGFITELMTLVGFFLFWLPAVKFSYSIGFFCTTLCLFSLLYLPKTKSNNWNYYNAVIIGLAQGCAFLPGISRFAVTFCAARWSAISSRKAFEISFLIEIPILFVAWSKGMYGLYKIDSLETILTFSFIVVTFLAMLLMYVSLLFVENLIKKEQFWRFSYYTLALAILTAI